MNGKLSKKLRREAAKTAQMPGVNIGFRVQQRPTAADKPKRLPAVMRALNPKCARYQYQKLKEERA